jgi:hypothetical protein
MQTAADYQARDRRTAIADMYPRPANERDPFTQVPIADLPLEDRVLVHSYGAAMSLLVSASGLLRDVKAQLANDVAIFETKLTAAVVVEGRKQEFTVLLNRYVWGQLVSRSCCVLASEFFEVLRAKAER